MKHRGELAADVVLLMLGVPLGAYVGAYYYRTVVVADLTVGNTGEPVEMRVFPTKWESALFTPLITAPVTIRQASSAPRSATDRRG